MFARSLQRLRGWTLMIIEGPAAQQTAAQFAHALLEHRLDFMSQRAIG